MKGTDYLHLLDKLQSKNRFLNIALIVMVALNIVNLIGLMGASGKVQTIITPIGGEGMQIGNGKADEKYIRRMARYITNQLGNYSAGSARTQYQELQMLFTPSQVPAVAAYFEKLVTDIERYPTISSSVEWAGTTPLKYTSNLIQVLAFKSRLVNGTITDNRQVHYCIYYHIEDARFFIDRFKEIEETMTDACFVQDTNAKAAADAQKQQ